MEAGHILLGRPWQSDRNVTHDGFTNRHSFVYKGRKTTLIPMTPHEVNLDQIHLKKDAGKSTSKEPNSKSNLFLTSGEVKRNLFARQPMLMNEACLTLTNHEPVLPSKNSFLQDPENAQERLSKISTKPEPNIQSFLCENRNKHCKDISVINTLPNLFVLVTANDEKCFDLSNVKEFCVSNSVFANMVKSFKNFEFEEFSKQKVFMFDELNNSDFVLSYNLFRKSLAHELNQKDQNFVINEQFSFAPRNDLCDSAPSKEKHDFTYLLISGYLDMICLPWSKVSNAGFRVVLKCKERIPKKVKDRLFKPPNVEHDEHHGDASGMLMKDEPPGATFKPTPILNQFGGNYLILPKSMITNFLFIPADHRDSRTNPFQVGGDDATQAASDDPGATTDVRTDEHVIDPQLAHELTTNDLTDVPQTTRVHATNVPRSSQELVLNVNDPRQSMIRPASTNIQPASNLHQQIKAASSQRRYASN